MEKKGTKIAYFIALAIVVIALVIAKVTNDGSGFIATGWALFPPVVGHGQGRLRNVMFFLRLVGGAGGARVGGDQ